MLRSMRVFDDPTSLMFMEGSNQAAPIPLVTGQVNVEHLTQITTYTYSTEIVDSGGTQYLYLILGVKSIRQIMTLLIILIFALSSNIEMHVY